MAQISKLSAAGAAVEIGGVTVRAAQAFKSLGAGRLHLVLRDAEIGSGQNATLGWEIELYEERVPGAALIQPSCDLPPAFEALRNEPTAYQFETFHAARAEFRRLRDAVLDV